MYRSTFLSLRSLGLYVSFGRNLRRGCGTCRIGWRASWFRDTSRKVGPFVGAMSSRIEREALFRGPLFPPSRRMLTVMN